MTHLLDTNTCIEHLRHHPTSPVSAKLASAPVNSVALCSVTVAELLYGARRSAQPDPALHQVQTFCGPFVSLPFDDDAADEYSMIRAHLESLGTPIGPNDLLIASIAKRHRLILVTHNTSEFSRVPGLTLEDWQLP